MNLFYTQGEYAINPAKKRYYFRDHLGSVIRTTDENGNFQWGNDYSAYGAGNPGTETNTPQFGYAGMMFHARSGLNLTHFRAYNPNTGRWLSTDPIGFAGGRNLYGYVGGNTTNYIDALGLETTVVVWQPVGYGSSSFGHTSIDINGTTYSFGPDGMAIIPTEKYLEKNSFREGMGTKLFVGWENEGILKSCLEQNKNKYNTLTNNCSSPVQECLGAVGIKTSNSILPVNLGNELLNSPFYNGVKIYPATSKPNGGSAPWAK